MKTLRDFQIHYGIDDTEEAKREYQRYLEALELFKRIEERALVRGAVEEERDGEENL